MPISIDNNLLVGLDLRVKDVMAAGPLTVGVDSGIHLAAKEMERCGCACSLVESKG
ncbi:MAG: hypothetical protein JRN68_03150 [Nitrososphaerota archaeon]|nr:hypothetical protein [Nitrososphaerota archaeon]